MTFCACYECRSCQGAPEKMVNLIVVLPAPLRLKIGLNDQLCLIALRVTMVTPQCCSLSNATARALGEIPGFAQG